MKMHPSHPDPLLSLYLVFEPNRLERSALEAAYAQLVPRARRASSPITRPEAASQASPLLRRKSA